MFVIPKINLTLNFKLESKSYRFVKDLPIDITIKTYEYLEKSYPGKFLKTAPIIHTIENTVVGHQSMDNNLLNKLIEVENKSTSSETDVKKIIEKALQQNIIIKQGTWYKVESESCRSIAKVKELLEKDNTILQKIMAKLK